MGFGGGIVSIPRTIAPNLSQASLLESSAANAKTPEEQARLAHLAAIERKWAEQQAAAQQVVQNEALNGGDLIYGDAQHEMAKALRAQMARRAAADYNAALPAGYTGQRKDPFGGLAGI